MVENRELAFNQALCARVRRLRYERGWTAERMATALGIPAERYRKYEKRTPLPHYLLEQFATIVGREVSYLLTGRIPPLARAPSKEGRRHKA